MRAIYTPHLILNSVKTHVSGETTPYRARTGQQNSLPFDLAHFNLSACFLFLCGCVDTPAALINNFFILSWILVNYTLCLKASPALVIGVSAPRDQKCYPCSCYLHPRIARPWPSDSGAMMTGAQFAKFCRDCRIIDRRVTPTEVDICYTRVREAGERRTLGSASLATR